MTVLLALYLIVIALDLFLQDRKELTVINFALMWVMMGWSFGNADYENYLSRYEQGFLDPLEFLYSAFQGLARGIGLNYQGFLIIMSLLFLGIRFFVILKMTARPNLVLGLWLVFPFLMDIVQLRQFYAMSLVLLGVYFLFARERYPAVKYLICVGTAFFIQNSAIFYVLLLIPWLLRDKGIGKRFEAFFAALTGVLFLLFFTGVLPAVWERLDLVFSAGDPEVSAAALYDWKMIRVYMAQVLLMFLLMAAADRFALLYAQTAGDGLTKKQVSYINWFTRANWMMLPILPVLILNKETYRFQHGLLIPFYIMVSYLRNRGEDRLKAERNVVFAGAAVGMLLLAFVFLFEFSGENLYMNVFRAAFDKNLLIKGF